MIYTRPFITKRFVAYEGDSHRSELSLAVRVFDDFTEEQPQVQLLVKLKELPDAKPFRSDRGLFLFEGRESVTVQGVELPRVTIPNGNYTLVVQPDLSGGNWFNLLPEPGGTWTNTLERPIVLPLPPLRPLQDVRLSPKSSYPFPANATLVRGKVTQGGGNVADAVVSTTYQQVDKDDTTQTAPKVVETLTDREGEFVLFFKKMPNKTQSIRLNADKDGQHFQQPQPVVITEGKTLKDQILPL